MIKKKSTTTNKQNKKMIGLNIQVFIDEYIVNSAIFSLAWPYMAKTANCHFKTSKMYAIKKSQNIVLSCFNYPNVIWGNKTKIM